MIEISMLRVPGIADGTACGNTTRQMIDGQPKPRLVAASHWLCGIASNPPR